MVHLYMIKKTNNVQGCKDLRRMCLEDMASEFLLILKETIPYLLEAVAMIDGFGFINQTTKLRLEVLSS